MLWTRYAIGYHGCDEELARSVVCKQKLLKYSSNDYDWLGNGIYFWEGSPERARKWAEDAAARSEVVFLMRAPRGIRAVSSHRHSKGLVGDYQEFCILDGGLLTPALFAAIKVLMFY